MKKIILAITCASIISSVNSFGVANAHYHDYHGHHDMNINTQTNRLNFDPLINNEIVDSMKNLYKVAMWIKILSLI